MRPDLTKPFDLAIREVVCTGIGFALGFGWIWFYALQAYWLPNFLWGKFWQGSGVTLFFILLLSGFLGLGIFCGWIYKKNNETRQNSNTENSFKQNSNWTDFRTTNLPHAINALSCLLAWLSALMTFSGPERPYLTIICMAFAALLQGSFWSGAMLSLLPHMAVTAFIVAALTAALSSYICSQLSFSSLPILFCLAPPLAWAAAWCLMLTLKAKLPETKRPRGRPPKIIKKLKYKNKIAPLYLYASVFTFFILVTGENILEQAADIALAPWTTALMNALGAVLVIAFCSVGKNFQTESLNLIKKVFICLKKLPSVSIITMLCIAALAWSITLISMSQIGPTATWSIVCIIEGSVCAVIFIILTPTYAIKALQYATYTLAGMAGLSIISSGISELLVRASAKMIPLAIAIPALLLSVLLFCLNRIIAQPPKFLETPSIVTSNKNTQNKMEKSIFTARENEILNLVQKKYSNRDIAHNLNIQEGSVRYHLRNIYKKTGLKNRNDLIMMTPSKQ